MTSETTKTCPECGENIQEQAVVCRYCGYDYRVGRRPTVSSTNGLAVASLVLGILWIYWIGSILALVFGYVARRQIDESGGIQAGRGMATAGVVLGWVGVATLVFTIVAVAISRPVSLS